MRRFRFINDPARRGNVRTQFTPDDARRFDDRFGSKQDTQGFYENPALDDLVKHVDFEHSRSVLEFGCGTGSFARRLFEMGFQGNARYLGLDISGTMIDLATKKLEPWQDRAEVRRADGTPCLPVPDTERLASM
jgi:SAM-dependent methyltransferase